MVISTKTFDIRISDRKERPMKTRFFASQTSPYNGSGEAAGTYVDALPAHAKAQDTWIPTLPVLTTD